MLDDRAFAEIARSPDEVAKHFGSDDIESLLRDGIRLQWLVSKPEDRNAERVLACVERMCRKLVPEVLSEFQNVAKEKNW